MPHSFFGTKTWCALTCVALFHAIPLLLSASTFSSTAFVPYPDGQIPLSPLLLAADGNFYGTTNFGGAYGQGTLFRMTPAGVRTTLISFNGTNGTWPSGPLLQTADGYIYGTTQYGGTSGWGTVFKLSPSGTLTTVVNFNGNTDTGSEPISGLILARDGNFYGITYTGTVFKLTPSGTLTTLANFNGYSAAPLIQTSDGAIYGTANGPSADGFVFKLTLPGTFPYGGSPTLSVLASFNGTNGSDPEGGLLEGSDHNLYGTTINGGLGIPASGTVYKVTPDGTLTTLCSFDGTKGGALSGELIEGQDGNFYSTAQSGGSFNAGTLFRVTPTGSLTTLVNFDGISGAGPATALVQDSLGNFYGTTSTTGTYSQARPPGGGTVFELTSTGSFTPLSTFACVSGFGPQGGIIQANDGYFYGTTFYGGPANDGTVFRYIPSGLPTTLVNFDGTNGQNPYAGLLKGIDGNLYGTTLGGTTSPGGSVFKVTTNGTLTTLVNFTGPNGSNPYAGLVQDNTGNFYGTTEGGGASNHGTVFKLTPSGSLNTLVSFNGNNGVDPYATLALASDGNLYGTTTAYSPSIFQVTPDGTLTTLSSALNFNLDVNSQGQLLQDSDGSFYGTLAGYSNSSGYGKIFHFSPGSNPTTVVAFNSTNGANPYAGLIKASDGNFYGTTQMGGSSNKGIVFQVTPTGTLTTLINFSGPNGANPTAGLFQANDGSLYGTTQAGGISDLVAIFDGCGTVFRLNPTATENFVFKSASDIPVTCTNYTVNGSSFNVTFGYAPLPGTVLTAIKNKGTAISGTFTNLPDGGTISAIYNGKTYVFTADYSGGTGADLTLTYTSGPPVAPVFTDGPAPSSATIGTPYSFTYTAPAFPPATFALTAGGLPPGLSLSASGVISGIPTLTGSYSGIVTASNGVIPSATQNFHITVMAEPQKITFPAIADHSFGDAPFNTGATASSGLPVYYTTTGHVKITGDVVTITGTGAISIRAHQDGNASYAAAATVLQSFTVAQGSQSITFAPISSHVSTDAPFALSATASSGLAVKFSVVSGPATISGSTLTLTGTGTVVVQASQAGNANYLAAPNVTQSFAVTQGIQSQTITFPAIANHSYGDAPFSTGATASSGLPISYTTTGHVKITGDLVTLTGTGTISIRAHQEGNANYSAATSVLRSFTVAQGTQSITFPPIPDHKSTDAPFTLNATASSGLAVKYRVLSGPASVSDSTLTLTSTGTVVVQASQAGNSGFAAAASVTRSFTAGRAPVLYNNPLPVAIAGNRDSQGRQYTAMINGTAYPSPTISLYSGTIPYGLTLGSSGIFSGVPTLPGTYTFTVLAANGFIPNATQTFTITVQQPPYWDFFASLTAAINAPFSYTVSAEGYPAPVFKATGLPPGITLSAAGIFLGTPTSWGAYPASLTATNSAGTFTMNFTFYVDPPPSAAPTFTSGPATSTATVGVPYRFDYTASGATGWTSYTMSLSAGSLPPGILPETVAVPPPWTPAWPAAGGFAGTPTQAGVYTGTVEVSDGVIPNATQNFSITVKPGPQKLTFPAIVGHTYGDPPFSTGASASTGLPVTYSHTGPVQITGDLVTITGAGAVSIRAHQDGNANYLAAPTVLQTFTVAQAQQSITFAPIPNHIVLDAPFALSATASSGLAVKYSVVSGPATISGSTVTLTGTGTVVVQAGQAGNANYLAAPNVTQSFAVTLASQTVTFPVIANHTYGDAPFSIGATASSGLPVYYTATGRVKISGDTVTITGTGPISIRAHQDGSAQYLAAPTVLRSFTVGAAATAGQ